MGITTSDDTRISLLNRIAGALANGPVIMGETHSSVLAREAIVYLIVNRHIRILSIEGPIIPTPLQGNQGALLSNQASREQYLGAANLKNNENYSFMKLVTIAQKYGVQVYFHDLPAKYAMNAVDPNYNQTVDGIQNAARRPLAHRMGNNVNLGVRNQFSGLFLGNAMAGGVDAVPHLAILVGSDHTQATACLGAAKTIQAHTNIPDTSVFNFS